jgi:murein L,D-transpeptidase YcbB/YkuD
MQKTWYILVVFIVLIIVKCNSDKKVLINSSKTCVITFNSIEYQNYLKDIFENKSDTSSICFSGLSNFDTLKTMYRNRGYNSIWFTDDNSFNLIDSVLLIFKNSKFHGLKPNWYFYSLITYKLEQVKSVKVDCDSINHLLAEVEVLLSNSLIDYTKHMCYGFFEPLKEYDKSYYIPVKQKDSLLFEKIFNPLTLLDLLNKIQPNDSDYVRLQKEYLKYLSLKWDSIPLPDTPKIALGDSNLVLKNIAKRLIVTGELDSLYKYSNIVYYDTTLKKAVIKFQLLHGLLADGVIGYNTINQLNISPIDRAIQIAVNLERLRWTNFSKTGKHLQINIPEFTLYAFNCDTFKFALKVCVGEKKPKNYDERMKKYLKTHRILDRPSNHETPNFTSKISHIILNPDWLVPINIVQKELYFNFIKDPFYLKDHDYKVYLNDKEVNPDSIKWSKYSVEHIPFRIKQDPGEINSLGKIKFVFYNPFDVFLHDTPSKNYFERAFRAVSHGCIRVENPLKLVSFLLNDDKKFELDQVRMSIGLPPEEKKKATLKEKKKFKETMKTWKEMKRLIDHDSLTLETKKIFLKKQASIVITYYTAFVDTNGFLEFRDDLYKRDLPIINRLK